MPAKPLFPTKLHQDTAELVRDYFTAISNVETILIVNSCARGQATPDSDLDFDILIKPGMTISEINKHETSWLNHIKGEQKYLEYKGSNPFAHLHVDIIDGKYSPKIIENAEQPLSGVLPGIRNLEPAHKGPSAALFLYAG